MSTQRNSFFEVAPRCNSDPGKMKTVKLDDFDIKKVLGKGAYGKVYQVKKNNGLDKGKIFAMKAVDKSRIMDSRTDMRHTQTERDVLVQVDHPFLIKLYYAFETDQRLYFVQEFQSLFQACEVSEEDLVLTLVSLKAKEWIKVLSDVDDEAKEPLELSTEYANYFYLATKKGLLAHNST